MRRFKERAPTRTVAIIRRFFAGVSEHLSLLETPVLDGGVGVYSLSLQLRYDDTELLRTHGKGMQPVYARASAYAELYERFCNRHGMTGCLLDDPSEETTPSLQHIAAAFPAFCGRETAFLRYLQSECPAVREKVFLPVAPADAPLRIDPRHIFSYCGTNGMAAGNTLSEALVQGMSELAERNVLCRCLRDDPLKLQEIPDAVLAAKAPESFEKIRKVRAKGFSLRFFDAAGATGLPVVVSLWVNRAHGVHAVKFGAFPVFSVAVERCITETMQGRALQDYRQYMPNAPYEGAGRMAFYRMLKYGDGLLPERLFTDAVPMETFPDRVYLDGRSGNRALAAHFAALGQTAGFHLYYRDVSLTPEMAAVQVFSPELNAVFPTEHLLMDDCPAAVSRFLDTPQVASAAQAAALLKLFDSVPALPDAMCARLHLAGLENWTYVYVVAMLSLCAGDVQQASDLLESMETTGGFEYLPDMAALRCFLRYRLTETQDDALRKKLAIWGYDDAATAPFFGDPAALCNRYLKDVLFGDLYRKNRALTVEVQRLQARRRAACAADCE